MIKHLSFFTWFVWMLSAFGQGQINLNNRDLALVLDSTDKRLTGTNFVAVILYGSSDATLSQSFAPAPFRASTTTFPGTWNPAAPGGPGSIAILSGFSPGATVTLRVAVYDSAVFKTYGEAEAAIKAGVSKVPTQAGISAPFTYTTLTNPLLVPGGMEKFPGLKLTALGNTGPVNQPPVAVGQTLSVNAGATLDIVLKGTDPENAPLKYAVVAQPANGTLTGTAPNLRYAPKAGFSGSDSFTFTVNDGSLTSAAATVAISVKAVTVNQPPVAVGQTLSVNAGATLDIVLNGTDPENAPLKYAVVAQPANGTLTGTAPNLRYAPKAGFSGSDSFTFTVNDGSLTSAAATVAISVKAVTVNQPPVADSQNVSLGIGESRAITLSGRDPEGATLKYALVSSPANGTLAGSAPNLTYTAKSGFSGNDAFTFKVSDGSLESAVATVSITVSEAGPQINLNNRTFALVNDAAGKPLTGTSFVAKIFYGASETSLGQSFAPAPFRDSTTSIPGTWNPAAAGGPGSLATLAGFKPGATVTLRVAVYDTAVFKTYEEAEAAIKAGASKVPTQAGISAPFTYTTLTDPLMVPGGMEKFPGLKLTALGNTGPVNQPPVAVGQTLSVNAGATLDLVLKGTDPENAPLKYAVVAQPANGTLTGTAPNLRYAPKAGFSGSDSFTFTVNDGSLTSAAATVAISVKAVTVNQPPVADSQNVSLGIGESRAITLSGRDPEGATLKYALVSSPANGTLAGSAPNLTYTAKSGFSGNDAFTFKVSDGSLESAVATVSITVSEAGPQINLNNRTFALVNDAAGKPLTGTSFVAKIFYGASETSLGQSFAPAPFRDSTTSIPGTWNPAAAGGPGSLATLAGFKPGATVTLRVAVYDTAVFKTYEEAEAAIKAGVSKVPTQAGISAPFTYTTLTDPLMVPGGMEKFPGLKLTALGNTGPVNQPPVAVGQTLSVNAGATLDIVLKGTDPENAPLKYAVVAQPANGTLTGTAPNLRYAPKAGFSGSDAFTFTVNDGSLTSAAATVAISVKAVTVNQPPVADSQNVSLGIGESRAITLSGRDPEGATLKYALVSSPANGTLAGSAPNLTYTAKSGFSGNDAFTFKVSDGSLESAVATVSITVSEAGPQINLNNRTFALVNDAAGKPLTGTSFVAKIFYGASETSLGQSFAPAPFRDSTTSIPGTWNPAAAGGPGSLATLAGFKPGATVTLRVAVYDTAVFKTYEEAEAAIKAGVSKVPTQAGISAPFTYTTLTDPLMVPGGMEKFPGLKLTALGNTGPVNQPPVAVGQTLSVNAGATLDIVLKGTDPENAPLKYAVVAQPANGTLTGTAPNLRYAPKAGFSGSDSFTFTVNDGSLTSAPALVGITVKGSTVVVTPPEFPVEPPPWDLSPCICGPLVGNYETNQIHTWYVLADGGPLDLQLTTVTVNTNDPQTTIVDAFDGTNRIATVTVSYTAAEARANGLRWEKSASATLGTFARGKVIRLESRIGGTPVTQTHHSLQFCGARWLAIDLPSFKALEEDHAAYRFNVKSGESLVIDLDNVGIPTPATGFRYRLISPSGTVVQRGTNAIVAGPELSVARPAVGLWTLEMRPVGGEHYLLDKPVGADRHAYLDWYTSQRGVKEVRITVNDRPAVGVPFDVSLTRVREVGDVDAGDLVVSAVVTNGLARFVELPNGYYTVAVRPLVKDIPAVASQQDWIYCNNPVTNLFAFRRKNDAPKFESIASATADEGKPFNLTLKATDPEGAPLGFSLVSGPTGITVTPAGLLTWTPSEDQGPLAYNVAVAVTDGLDSVTNQFTISVREVNVPPVAGTVPRQTVDEGKPLSLTLAATDVDLPQQILLFRLVKGPVGLTVSPEGRVAWTPGEDAGGTTETVSFTVTDGLASATGEFQVAVNELNEAPVVQPVADQTIDALKRLAIQLVARDADLPAQKLVFSLLSGPIGMTVSSSGLLEWTPSVDQGRTTNKVEVTVTDGVAKAGTAFVLVVRPSNTAPRIADIAPRTINELASLSLTLNAVDDEVPAQKLTFALVSGPEGLAVSPAGVVTFRPTEAQGPGTNRVVVSVTDNGVPVLSGTNAFSLIVAEVNEAPELSPVDDQMIDPLKPWGITLSAKDSDLPAQKLVFGLVNGPRGLTVADTGEIRWTPTLEQGGTTNRVEVSVGDGVTRSTTVFAVVVRPSNTPPVLADVSLRRVSETRSINFNLSATDADLPAQALTFSLVAGPDGLTVSPAGQVAFAPTEAQGPSTNRVVVRVTDSGVPPLSSTNAFSVVVLELNQPPVLAAVPDQSVDALKPFTVRLVARDEDIPAQRLTFALVEGPRGMVVNPADGVLTWTPAVDQASARHPVTVSVSDGLRVVSASFQVEVRSANSAPTFVGLSSRLIRELSATSFRLAARDADLPAQRLTFGLVDGPKGLTVAEDGTVNWTPTEEQGPSTNRVVVRVTDNGTPVMGSTNAFTLIVSEANSAPTFINAFSRSIFENAKFSSQLIARDADLPAQTLSFALVSGPRGLTVSETGLMEWTPGEDQGPSTNRVVVRVTDSAAAALSATATLTLTVREANAAPVFPSTNYTVAAQSRLSVTLAATDSDLPAQVLTYSLTKGPAGLTVSTNGLLQWTPPANFANTTNLVTVSVRDGVAAVTSTLRILVGPVGSGSGSEAKVAQRTRLSLQLAPDQSLVLRAVGPAGARYQLESTSLPGGDWEDVQAVGVIETQGEEEPVEVPLPADEAGGFRQFRLRKL